ncbi:MAG: hypothetical protein ACI4GA_00635 [Acutalibacteraceae bacterium]
MKKIIVIILILAVVVVTVCAAYYAYIKQHTLDKDGMENPDFSEGGALYEAGTDCGNPSGSDATDNDNGSLKA